MQVKRFVAANMSLALKKVREEIGADAVILSNKRVPGGVELVVTIEEQAVSADTQAQSAEVQASIGFKAPSMSKLEMEVDRMQGQARQRASALAATLGYKERGQFEQEMLKQNKAESSVRQSRSMKSEPHNGDARFATEQLRDSNAVLTSRLENQKILSDETNTQMAEMRRELQSMRDLMQQQLSSMAWGQFSSNDPERASLWRQLKRMGIDAHVADNLLNQAGDLKEHKHAWMSLMTQLTSDLPIVGHDLVAKGGLFCFVGPTGAGKTTTIGKLAARHVMEHGVDDIALVTTDTYRIAAHEQLRTIGRILNVPVKVVDKQNTLERILYALRHKKLVLIDTAGLNNQDKRLLRQTQTINELGAKVLTVLVLPTTSQPQVLKAAYHHYKTDNLTACILTKLDETTSLGESISLLVDKSLPIAYSTNGQNIPNDITIAESSCLVRMAVSLARNQTVDDMDMSEELQSLIG